MSFLPPDPAEFFKERSGHRDDEDEEEEDGGHGGHRGGRGGHGSHEEDEASGHGRDSHRRRKRKKTGKAWYKVDWSKACCRHKRPDLFTSSQWQQDLGVVSWYYLTYRSVVFVFVFVNFAVYLATLKKEHQRRFPIYLTSQGLILLTGQQLMDLVLAVVEFVKQAKVPTHRHYKMPVTYSINWVLYILSSVAALLITAFYWAFEFKVSEDKIRYSGIFVHGLNCVVVLADLFVSAKPWRWQHLYIPLLMGVWYTAFSVVYFAAGGTNHKKKPYIYRKLDWSTPGPTMGLVFAALASLVLFHLLLCGLCWLRKQAYGRLYDKGEAGRVVGPMISTGKMSSNEMSKRVKRTKSKKIRKVPFLSGIPPGIRESSLMREEGEQELKQEDVDAMVARNEAQRPDPSLRSGHDAPKITQLPPGASEREGGGYDPDE